MGESILETHRWKGLGKWCTCTNYSGAQTWANSADPNQTIYNWFKKDFRHINMLYTYFRTSMGRKKDVKNGDHENVPI